MFTTKTISLLVLGFAAALTSASPSIRAETDWKYAHGWDGTTLPPIGTPLKSSNSSLSPVALSTQAVGGVFICTDINWGGTCGYAVQPLNTCIVLGSDWKDKISSFGPDKCTECRAWVTTNCQDLTFPGGSPTWIGHWDFDYPGDATGGLTQAFPPAWNDRIESFSCHQVSC